MRIYLGSNVASEGFQLPVGRVGSELSPESLSPENPIRTVSSATIVNSGTLAPPEDKLQGRNFWNIVSCTEYRKLSSRHHACMSYVLETDP